MNIRQFLTSIILGIFLLLGEIQPASAQAPIDASTFALGCDFARGRMVLDSDTHVRYGVGLLNNECLVELADGVRLEFTGVTLISGSRLRIGGGSGSEVRITGGSYIETTGELTISPGVSFLAPNANFDDAALHVVDSTLICNMRGVSLGASLNGDRGFVRVVNSALVGVNVFVSASCSGSGTGFCTGGTGADGTVQIVNSILDAGSNTINVETFDTGETTVENSTLIGATIRIHSSSKSGTCKSKNNTPFIECT